MIYLERVSLAPGIVMVLRIVCLQCQKVLSLQETVGEHAEHLAAMFYVLEDETLDKPVN